MWFTYSVNCWMLKSFADIPNHQTLHTRFLFIFSKRGVEVVVMNMKFFIILFIRTSCWTKSVCIKLPDSLPHFIHQSQTHAGGAPQGFVKPYNLFCVPSQNPDLLVNPQTKRIFLWVIERNRQQRVFGNFGVGRFSQCGEVVMTW